MAIGVDNRLRSQQPAPLAAPAPQPNTGAAPRFGSQPPAISDRAVSAQANNQLASGAGAREATLRGMDRAGVSRGKGQQYMAEAAQADADASGRAAAANTEAAAGFANVAASRAYENTMRGEQLRNEGLLENLRSASAQEEQSRRGLSQNLYEAIARGRANLNNMQLDYVSPLLRKLFQQGG